MLGFQFQKLELAKAKNTSSFHRLYRREYKEARLHGLLRVPRPGVWNMTTRGHASHTRGSPAQKR